MNTKEYIESGILEAYALNSLSPGETKEVAENIARYPELAQELDRIENAMMQYSSTFAKVPPLGLENKIWDAIQASGTDGARVDAAPAMPPKPQIIPLKKEYTRPAQWKYAAAIIVLVGSIATNAVLWNKGNRSATETASLVSKMDSLTVKQQQLAQLVDGYQKAKVMMSDTGMQTIVMHTMQKGHPMAATLYWSKGKGEAYVSVDGLPAPPHGMQYQLWAIKDGKPVNMGILPNEIANTPSMQKVAMPASGGEAFAISLEKEGGSTVPTMENIYVLGKA